MQPDSPNLNQQRAPQRQMAQYRIVDEQHGGLVVSTFAHPSGWRARGQVDWNMQHTNLPAQVYAAAFNPNGTESVEFFPTQAFYWIEGDATNVAVGQNSHGLVRMPPRSAPDALVQLIIPHFRGDRQNLRVVCVQPVQNLWQVFSDPPPQQGEGLMARVEYEERGHAFEEEFYGVCEWVPAPGALNWGFGRLFSFRAGRGQLDPARETFWQIAGSLRSNPQWAQLCQQIAQQLMAGVRVRDGEIRDILDGQVEIGRRNIAYNDWLIKQRGAQVGESVRRQERLNHEWSQQPAFTAQDELNNAIFNRTAFEDPNSATGNLHFESGNPQHVFRNEQGEWYSTDDPTDNPNHHRGGNWVEVTPIEPHR